MFGPAESPAARPSGSCLCSLLPMANGASGLGRPRSGPSRASLSLVAVAFLLASMMPAALGQMQQGTGVLYGGCQWQPGGTCNKTAVSASCPDGCVPQVWTWWDRPVAQRAAGRQGWVPWRQWRLPQLLKSQRAAPWGMRRRPPPLQTQGVPENNMTTLACTAANKCFSSTRTLNQPCERAS